MDKSADPQFTSISFEDEMDNENESNTSRFGDSVIFDILMSIVIGSWIFLWITIVKMIVVLYM